MFNTNDDYDTDVVMMIMKMDMIFVVKPSNENAHSIRPGRLLLRFFEPKSLTRENKLSLLGFSQFPMLLLGLLAQRPALAFSRSLACLFCRMRLLAIAAAVASLALWCGDASQIKKCTSHTQSVVCVRVLYVQNIVTDKTKSILRKGLRNGHFRSTLFPPQGPFISRKINHLGFKHS